MADLEDFIENLSASCPTECSPERTKINVKMDEPDKRYKDTSNVLFDYDIGG